jgi:streptogrisin C
VGNIVRKTRVILAAASALGMVLGVVDVSSVADARESTSTQSGEIQTTLPTEVTDALQRHLGVTKAELQTRLGNEEDVGATVQRLEDRLGASFAGAWLTGDEGDLTVATTDAAEARAVRTAGATPKVVIHSEDALDAAHAALDRRATAAPDGITGWYVDVTTNRVVVQTLAADRSAAARFVASSGADTDTVRVEVTTDRPRLLTHLNVRGGDAYFTPNARCSIGFSVVGGYTTAGHCGTTGTSTWGFNGTSQGTFRGSVFPTRDYGWVQVNGSWTPRPWVNNYQGGNVLVRGSQEAAVGASVCRSGSTTGWHCGTIQAKNQTVRYPQGTVFGLTRTSVCAEPGDSGGSYISGNQAQGMTSGGSGNCTFGGTTFFQPINPTLQAFGLTLVTG